MRAQTQVLAVVVAAGLASGDVRETASFTDVVSAGELGSGNTTVLTHTFSGGYGLGRIDFAGVLELIAPETFGSEARVRVTHPSGPRQVFTLNPPGQTAPGFYNESGSFEGFGLGADPSGEWTFEFFDAIDDPGDPDAVWRSFDWSLTDETPAAPAAPFAIDLGTIGSGGASTSSPLNPGAVAWFRFEIGGAAAFNTGTFLDITTNGSSITPLGDTAIGLFDRFGRLIAQDDDGGDDLLSLLSFGSGSGAPGSIGQHSYLFEGEYYLAVGGFFTEFDDGFGATSVSTERGDLSITFATNIPASGVLGVLVVGVLGRRRNRC